MNYIPKLVGEKVYLSPMTDDVMEMWAIWVNDLTTGIKLDQAHIMLTPKKSKEEFTELNKKTTTQVLTIVDKKTHTPIGACGFDKIHPTNRSADFFIVIGEPDFRNKGYGKEAAILTLDYGFNILNLNSIWLGVYSFNKNALAMYERIGFKQAGVLREAIYVAGKYYDVILMDIVESEFESPCVSKLFKE